MIAKSLCVVALFTFPGQAAPVPKLSQQVVSAMFAAFNRHDPAGMERLYDGDARLTSSDFCHARNHRDVHRTYQTLFTAFPDIQDEVETMIVQGDRVAVRFVAKSVSGKMSLTIHTFLRVHEGKIVEDDSVFDTGGRACTE